MRPELLNPLFVPVSNLEGIGPKLTKTLTRLFHGNENAEAARIADLCKSMPIGETRYVSGKVEWFNGKPNMVHPDHMVSEEGFAKLPLLEPVYPVLQRSSFAHT